MTEGEKEKIKLRAAYINGIANAFAVAGAFTLPVASATAALHPAFVIPFAALCFVVSLRLHLLAQDALDGLDQ